MKSLLISAAALAATLAVAPAAFAEGAQNDMSFTSADTDNDGFLSMTELQVQFPDYDQGKFDLLDADKSGTLTELEYASLEAGPESLSEGAGTSTN